MTNELEEPRKGYTLAGTGTADMLRQILSAIGEESQGKDLTPEEEALRPDTYTFKVSDPESLKMAYIDPETGEELPVKALTSFSSRFRTKFFLTPKGVACEIGGKEFTFSTEGWEAWYTPDRTIDDLAEMMDGSRPARRKRPKDVVALDPFSEPIRLWTQGNLTFLALDVASSPASHWKRRETSSFNGYSIETNHGMALIENITDEGGLQVILRLIGPEGLQCTLATLAYIGEVVRRNHGGELPENRNDIKPIKILASDLLRTMQRKKEGNTYRRAQQLKMRQYLKAQSQVDYVSVKPTSDKRPRLNVGPLINVLNYEVDAPLPFDELTDPGEVISITVLPGEAAYDMLRKGINWLPAKLLAYHPVRQRFDICIGIYASQLAVNRRNKSHPPVSMKAIIEGAGLDSLDSNPSRCLQRTHDALRRLADDGVIPANVEPNGTFSPIFDRSKTDGLTPGAITTEMKVAVFLTSGQVGANGYQPVLPAARKELDTTNTP